MLQGRVFARADAPPDPDLLALLSLGEAASLAGRDPAVALSAITTPRVRALFGGQPTTFRTVAGATFTVDGADIFAATVAAGYLPEARDFATFMHLVRPGSVIVDVGANFGLYSISAALYARPQGRVFAFEPAPGAFALLERNIAQNNLGSLITAFPNAVAAARGRAPFYVGGDVSFSSLHRTQRIGDEASTVEVETVTLDEALARVASIDLLKIDVEGGEADVLLGARELLKRSRAPIVQFEFSHKNVDRARRQAFADVLAMLAQDGLRIYRRGVNGPAALPAPEEAFSGNLFLARDGDGENRLRRALERTRPPAARPNELASLALLHRLANQSEALQRAEALQREVIEVADAVVGETSGGSEAVRAVQRAWLEARTRAREAEGMVNALSASVEGREKIVEQNAEKIERLRAVILALEARSGRLESERNQLLEKSTHQRTSIAQLTQSLEESRAFTASVQERHDQKAAAWREADARVRERMQTLEDAVKTMTAKVAALRAANERSAERIEALEASLRKSNEKVLALRAANAELVGRLGEFKAAQHELSRVRSASKRLNERYLELQAKLAQSGGAPRETSDEKA